MCRTTPLDPGTVPGTDARPPADAGAVPAAGGAPASGKPTDAVPAYGGDAAPWCVLPRPVAGGASDQAGPDRSDSTCPRRDCTSSYRR
ncbi:hypothetical protein Prubr_30030 [Polymorphospora rubra]|uniref:Uncharacterized protein n=1 Tax=Polymorphospora rubra TaxID=338584 RepID=A0A810MY16_9ACTN|nr:hypothetical protein Prubr_30030 [Polymorphospora rubra]